jgi:hypothetical protein
MGNIFQKIILRLIIVNCTQDPLQELLQLKKICLLENYANIGNKNIEKRIYKKIHLQTS